MQPSFGAAPSPYPLPGEVLDGKYRIEQMLGEGGMGAVAKATHVLRRAPVALKFMSPAVLSMQGAVERFVNEGVAASQIDSDHVVKVFDVGRLPSGAPYLVMEFLEGRDLSQLLEREGPVLPVPRAVHFTVQALRALHTAHAAGIVHRDMKPSNCFVIQKDGEPDFVKLVDFGISKVRAADDGGAAPAPHLTKTNSALGTPLYMSPEQARSPRDVDHRSDLYSVGAILYEMLAGRTPYTSDTGEFTEILFKIFTTDPEPLRGIRPDLPEGLADVVHRALLRDREGRFASAIDMAEVLAPYADERSREQFSRLRSTRRSSMMPPGQQHAVTPLDASARATQSEATARTYASSLTPPAPPVPTAGGVSREAPGATKSKSRAGVVAGAVAGVVAIGVAGVLAMRSHEAPAQPPRIGSDHAATQSAPATPAVAPPAPIETAVLAPTAPAAEAPKPSATPAHPAPSAPKGTAAATAPSARPATPGAPLPSQLGDLKLH
jgi:serine/threonine-protein kinase